jgi:hypothetical protein
MERRDFIGEVDVAGGVDQVQDVHLAVLGLVVDADGVGLDGDAALALDIHAVEQLGFHVAVGHRARRLDQPVGQRGFAVVDVRHDGEIADLCELGHARGYARELARGQAWHMVEGVREAASLRGQRRTGRRGR